MKIEIEQFSVKITELESLREIFLKEHEQIHEKMKRMEESINGKIKTLEAKKNNYEDMLKERGSAIFSIDKAICALIDLECNSRKINEEN
jgi:hypothetical protein